MKKATLAPVSPGVEGEESTSETILPGPLIYSVTNDATDNFFSRYFSPTACTISPLSLLQILHKHAPLPSTHAHFFFGFSYVARCPS